MSEVDSHKFDTCKHRSIDMEIHGTIWCCGSDMKEGFVCHKLTIYDLIPQVCLKCTKYEEKEKLNG
jgi:hypothetical protein